MSDHQELKDQARSKTRSLLAYSQSFRNLEREEQMALYKDLVNAHYNDLAEQSGLSTEMAAGDLIDADRHRNERIGGAGKDAADIMGKLVNKVNFPGFVRDLLVGVFDANQDANERQMRAYQQLLREATKSLSEFVNSIDDNEALFRLTQMNNDYKLSMAKTSGRGRRGRRGDNNQSAAQTQPATETPKPILVDKDGKEVNMNDNVIQAKILDTKLALAKERRTLLRETILMGVSRLVVEKGVIRANVKFRIDAYEDTTNDDKANETLTNSVGFNAGFNFGSFGFGTSFNRTKSQVSIATSNTEMGSELSAEMEGFVEIQFKSDYFKLDNFRETFDLGQGQVAQVPAGAAPQQQLPPQVAPPAPPVTPQ
ncbi:hypothetical protein H6G80_30250 [Nostoc sp. FACHB-87]|uniref:hypothetical protein n=1 Tax=Nostocaceae TaxID=1162 RepID=UPI0016885D59|nr:MULTISPECIES: hypothetical protein [Nostocaceae]MBD2458336.1 hypothetical protein [Nostoc sp. FACHB-87]MBD2479353.1 hypothetical protein [Anabaena sp. FACHB-83]